jgi:hypothetical protein
VKAEFWRPLCGIGLGLAMLGPQGAWAAGGEELPSIWPRKIATPQGLCTVFQPQPTALRGDRLTARAALAVAPPDSTNVVFGIAQIGAQVTQDADRQRATLSGITIEQARFVPADTAAMSGLAEALKPELAQLSWTLPSASLDESLEAVTREREAARELKATPPLILRSSTPAVLIVLDGPPQLRPVTNSPVMRVVNTPMPCCSNRRRSGTGCRARMPGSPRQTGGGSGPRWLSPRRKWPWRCRSKPRPPRRLSAVREACPPRLLVSSEPAELVVTRGEPTYTPVDGNDLLYVSNSDQLLFLDLAGQQHYVAFSGRWYRSVSLDGPWEAVPAEKLPAAFARIPPGSPKSEALTYVAGTTEAEDAVLRAGIPQITAVDRSLTGLEVKYDGAPQFTPVADTGVQSAANTDDAVFLIDGTYYVCRDAVWYTGSSPEGPWSVATTVPADIQSLPPSHPHYNVKYVYVYGSTPEGVYVGYVPGYAGCYVAGPTVVYGTGWWYPGYYGPSCYWAYPATFGFGFGYNSWSGWSVGAGFGYGWLSCGYGWGWGGCYPMGWWGPSGAYWACAPRYPCYTGHHRPPHNGHPGGPPGPHHPPPVAGRSEPRRDVPTANARPSNPQRRTLPEYGRTVKPSFRAPTTLTPARGAGTTAGVNAVPTRTAGPNASSMPQRTADRLGGNTTSPGRTTAGGLPGTAQAPMRSAATAQPGRTAVGSSATTPVRSPSAPIASSPVRQPAQPGSQVPVSSGRPAAPVPQRGASLPGNSPAAARPGGYAYNPSVARSTAPTANPAFSRQVPTMPRTSGAGVMQAPSRRNTGSGVQSPSYATPPAYRSGGSSAGPSNSRFGAAPSMRSSGASWSAPTRSSGSAGFSAPTRSAPSMSSPGFSRGSSGGGGPSRGR